MYDLIMDFINSRNIPDAGRSAIQFSIPLGVIIVTITILDDDELSPTSRE